MVRQNGSFSHEKTFCQPIHEAAMSNPPMPLNRLPCLNMVMVLMVYGCSSPCGGYGALCRRKRELRPFSYLVTDPLHRSRAVSGQVGFCGYGRGTSAVRTKTQLAQYETKKWGYTAKGKKVGLGVFLAHRFGDGRLIAQVSIGHISIHTAIGMYVCSDSCISVWVTMWIAIYVDMCLYG